MSSPLAGSSSSSSITTQPPTIPKQAIEQQDASLASSNVPFVAFTDMPTQVHPHPLGLPDIDDVSMSHVSTYVEFYQQDLFWSYLSDLFFIMGGIAYVVMSAWDCFWPEADTHYGFDAIGPAIYVFNSSIDVQWALHVQRRNKIKKNMKSNWVDFRASLSPTDDDSAQKSAQESSHSWCHALFKHAAHRRTLLAAYTFGISALLAFASVLCESELINHGRLQHILAVASAHVYILSALVCVTGKRIRPWLVTSPIKMGCGLSSAGSLLSNPETLEDLGDMLFFIGSCVDATLVDFHLDQQKPMLGLVADTLWLVDAFLYLRADIIMSKRIREMSKEQQESVILV